MTCLSTKFGHVVSLCLIEEAHRNEMPSDVRPCVVAQDCVVSQWSAWARTQDGCVASSGKVSSKICNYSVLSGKNGFFCGSNSLSSL
jgi:hypothetical protein